MSNQEHQYLASHFLNNNLKYEFWLQDVDSDEENNQPY